MTHPKKNTPHVIIMFGYVQMTLVFIINGNGREAT